MSSILEPEDVKAARTWHNGLDAVFKGIDLAACLDYEVVSIIRHIRRGDEEANRERGAVNGPASETAQ